MAAGADNIRFLGAVSANQVRALLPDTRALIVPSLFPETFGYVLLEAWSQGIPTLASGAGALPQVTSQGCGRICRSTEDFAHRIDHLQGDPGVARERGLAGWHEARDRFNEGAHVKAWESIVQECQTRSASPEAENSRRPEWPPAPRSRH